MFLLKACPRCHGDLHLVQDHYGGYVACMQCGHHLSVLEEADLRLSLQDPAIPSLERNGAALEPAVTA